MDAALLKEQDYRVLGGPVEQSITGGTGAYKPDVSNSNQLNSVKLPPHSLWMVVRKAIHLFGTEGGEFARAKLVDSTGKVYDSVVGKTNGQTIEQSEGEPLAEIIDAGPNGLVISILIDRANPDPLDVAASFTLKAVIPNPTRDVVNHTS